MMWHRDQLESVHCDCCGASNFTSRYRRPDGLVVMECNECGLACINPRPNADLVSRLYNVDYFEKGAREKPASEGIGYTSYLDGEGYKDMVNQTRIRFAITSKHVAFKGAKVLEVGCATGEFCGLVVEAGAAAQGIDLSEAAIDHARRRFPKAVFRAVAVETLASEEFYDAVFAFEVIEHVISPSNLLMSLAGKLRQGGVLALTTPNCDCARDLEWVHWEGFRRSFEHLHYFGADELSNLGQKYGLSLVDYYTWGGWPSDLPARGPNKSTKAIFNALRLMELARKLRASYRRMRCPYQRRGSQCNLLMLFRREPNKRPAISS